MRQQQQQQEYTPGTTVFAKLKGYPWWPARIESDQSVPAKILKQKSKSSKGTLYTVFFYGSRDYGFFGPDAIRPFDPVNVQVDLKAKKFKTKDLEMAIRQALNPALLAEIEQEEEEEEEEEEEKEKEEEEDTKTKKGKKKNVEPKKKAVKQAAPKRKSRKGATDSNLMEISKSEQVQDRKKRRKSMSIEKETEEEEEEEEDRKATTKEGGGGGINKKSPEYKKIYILRHKLQRFVYNKKEGEIPREDYPKIINVIKEIEEAPMTYTYLKDTKIGKVVKAATSYPFENDGDGIKDRCQQLMRNWKHSFIELQPHKVEKDGDTIMQEA